MFRALVNFCRGLFKRPQAILRDAEPVVTMAQEIPVAVPEAPKAKRNVWTVKRINKRILCGSTIRY